MQTITRSAKSVRCGFCSAGNRHDLCPGGVRNGDGSIVLCSCTECEQAGQPRCTDCNNRTLGEVGPDWKCIDADSCQAEVEARLSRNPVVISIRQAIETATERTREERRAENARKAREVTGDPTAGRSEATEARTPGCWCGCEAQTKGGKFLPGHDARYLSRLVKDAARGPRQRQEGATLAGMVSPAFQAKYEKRTANH